MNPELSILVAAHREGLIAHKTMLSLERALSDVTFSYEIIVTIDNGDDVTKNYFHSYKKLPINVHELSAGDLAASRNFAIKKSTGHYLATLDADDLVSKNWFIDGVAYIKKSKQPKVLHTSHSINFGTQNILWEKYNSRNISEDSLIMVWANRWDSAIITSREVLSNFPYQPNLNGYGSEDWHFNSETLANGIPHEVVPHTILFVRRKDVSEMTIQASERRTLHYTSLLSFETLKALEEFSYKDEPSHQLSVSHYLSKAKHHTKRIVKTSLLPVHRVAKKHIPEYTTFVKRIKNSTVEADRFPKWLTREWREMHTIEKMIFPNEDLLSNIEVYHSEMYDLGNRFQSIVKQFSSEPDYLLFLPSLNRGGAELVAINYIHALTKQFPEWKIAVIATENIDPVWKKRLPSEVDYVEFGKLTEGISYDQKLMLLARLIVQSKASKLHIAQSALMYRFASLYQKFLSQYIVTAFAFCEDKDNEGRISGHIHSGLPLAYPVIDHIFTDNNYVIDQLVSEYAFDRSKFSVLYQPFHGDIGTPITHDNKTLRILWASRVSKQKRPDILKSIAENLDDKTYSIDMYGILEEGFIAEDFLHIPALTYRGDFSSIQDINTNDYDIFLYTSENDGVPNILIEISAKGLPVIAPNIGGIKELLKNSSLLIEDNENATQYLDALSYFKSLSSADKSEIVRDVQKTIQKSHNEKLFNTTIKNELEQL